MFICLLKTENDNIFLFNKLKFRKIFCTMNRLWQCCLSKQLKHVCTFAAFVAKNYIYCEKCSST